MTSLRTQFARYSRLPPSGSSGVPKTPRQKWVLDNMQFMAPSIKKRPSVSTMEFEDTQKDIQEVNASFDDMDIVAGNKMFSKTRKNFLHCPGGIAVLVKENLVQHVHTLEELYQRMFYGATYKMMKEWVLHWWEWYTSHQRALTVQKKTCLITYNLTWSTSTNTCQ